MSQIKTKFFEDDSVTDAKIRLRNAQYLRSRNAANSANVNMLRVNGSDVIEFPSVPKIVGTPSADDDVATIATVKDLAAGLRDPKDAVRAASSSNITLPPGGTSLTIDGVTIANNDRVLLAGQSSGAENGIYVASGIGSSVVLARASDMNASAEVSYGLSTLVVEGTSHAGSTWMLTTADPITLGSTPLTVSKIASGASYTGGDMIALSGTTFSVDLATSSGLESSNPGNAAGQLRAKVSSDAAVKDRTTKIDAGNELEGLKSRKQIFTLDSTNITNGYIDLDQVAHESSIGVVPVGGPMQREGTDYTLNYTGGSGSKTRITWAGDLATGGAAALVSGDIVVVSYSYL
jgi:hypothetical protein